MEIAYRNTIYDRLLEIRFTIDIEIIPNPAAINQKIGECHAFIEEIEHFSIKISKEISIKQQALNNATAALEVKKSDIFTNNSEVKNLPSIKDREAAANMLLREEQVKVTEYENDVTDLNNLLKSINLKIRNLNRANNDIKMQLRIFEAQAKIGGVGPSTNYAAKSMLEELEKSTIGEDSFGDAEAEEEEEEEKVVDPSTSLDVESLLDGKEEPKPSEEEMAEKLIDPVPNLSPDTDGESPIEIEDDWPVIDQETVLEVEKVIEAPELENKEIDLDALFVTSEKIIQEGGKEEKSQTETQIKIEVAENQKERHTVETGMDLDDLLDSFQPTKN
jgi:hypothetical protein